MACRHSLKLGGARPAFSTDGKADVSSGAADWAAIPIATALRHEVGAAGELRTWRHEGLELCYLDTGGVDLPLLVGLHAIGHGGRDFEGLVVALTTDTDRKFNRMRPSMARRSGNLTALKSAFLAAAASSWRAWPEQVGCAPAAHATSPTGTFDVPFFFVTS